MKPIRNPHSAPGHWYIDAARIDCGASQHLNAMDLSRPPVGVMESGLELAGIFTRELAVGAHGIDSL
jgi:hypothetical protein